MRATNTLLIVDDEPDIIEIYEAYLFGQNYRILKAQNGAEALAIIRNDLVTAVMTDLNMPIMGGIDLITNTRAENFWLPMMVITAYGDKAAVVKSLRAGVFNFLEKPVTKDRLIEATRAMMTFADRLAESLTELKTAKEKETHYFLELMKTQKTG